VSVFRLLALHTPRPVHRETLLQLWPGLPEEQATHSLQVAVSSLRSLLVPDAPRGSARMVERIGDSYALSLPPGSCVDVVDFSAAVASADRDRGTAAEADALARAVALYRGDLLPEEGTAEWVVRERDGFRLRAAAACARLAELHLVAGAPDAAAAAARRGIEIDPYADASWRLLVRAYERTGDAAAAARARREYAAVLRDLGVPAAPRTASRQQR
jgi:DNA-binding SARP family transcriptional activator